MYFTLVLHFVTFIIFDEMLIKFGKTTNMADQHVFQTYIMSRNPGKYPHFETDDQENRSSACTYVT